ncbi:hypothetical protein EYB25_004645 [Talaromyces marneffei]|uniref:uncharacterized protein n=1 Tax=Talaromyces marneffei TaxID=37727 RepID=UPI0012A79C81|nr:uncharacterized protein EYB26_004275 [Talaromyces marneffei]KAE8553263.1 hypothetical protein EYB25_004645 [Talaromyces marneffei]QGA16608.1 hypothetical protein EYB26_004275 [Talaromyces marneffei]
MAHIAPNRTGASRCRRIAANSQTRASATPQPRPLAPTPTPSVSRITNPVTDPNIDPRLQGVIMTEGLVADDDEHDMQDVQVDPAFEADLQSGNGDFNWAAAVSALLLLGATGQATVPSRHEMATPQFNVFQALQQHVHIFFHFVTCLDVDTLVSLYAISKDLHNMVNTTNTAVILAQAMHYAPKAASIFPFRCYRKLCNDDPRVNLDVTRGQSRLIPSFRWLRMVHWRDQIAHKIVSLLNEEGLYLPVQGETAIKKIWFLMDIPDNQRRLATIQNPELWSTADLFYSCMFFMRIDMRCTDPLATRAHGNIRRMLMAQPSMTMLCRVLERKFLLNKHEAMQTYVRWKFTARDGQQPRVFDVPQEELGLLQYEGYGKEGSRAKLQRPDELVVKECVRRGMNMETAFFCMLNCTGPRLQNLAATAAEDDDDVTMILDEADK